MALRQHDLAASADSLADEHTLFFEQLQRYLDSLGVDSQFRSQVIHPGHRSAPALPQEFPAQVGSHLLGDGDEIRSSYDDNLT